MGQAVEEMMVKRGSLAYCQGIALVPIVLGVDFGDADVELEAGGVHVDVVIIWFDTKSARVLRSRKRPANLKSKTYR